MLRKTPLKRSTRSLAKSPIKKVRRKPRLGRLKGAAMTNLRRACFERDGYRCKHMVRRSTAEHSWWEECGCVVTWETGDMAHIVSRGAGGKDELSNVVTKCRLHHRVVEHAYGKSGEKPVKPK